MRGWLWMLIVLVLSTPAEAQTRRSVLVLRLEHPGLGTDFAGKLEEAMRAGVKRALPRYTLLPAPEIELAALQRAAGCVTDDRLCLVGIGRTLDAAQVVRVRLEGTRDRARLTVERVRTRSGTAERYEAELGALDEHSPAEMAWHLERAFGRNIPPLVGRVDLVAQTEPERLQGAQLRLDDKPVTAEALEEVPAGDHKIEVRQIGFEPFIWHGGVRPGRTTRVEIRWVSRMEHAPELALRPAPTSTAVGELTEESDGPDFAATWILGSATVIAATASTVLAVTVLKREKDAEEEGLDCQDLDRNHPTCSAGRRQALMTTIGWGVTGALAVATVTALVLEWPSSEAAEQPVQVGLALTRGGAAASLSLAFP